MQFSLRRFLIITTFLAMVIALVGTFWKYAKVESEFPVGIKKVVIESQTTNPRGTFFTLRFEGKTLIRKKPIGIRPLNPSKFVQTDLGEQVFAFQYAEAERLDLILLVDTSIDAYAVYWGSNRADKCDTVDWGTWDQKLTRLTDQSILLE